jgi:hypothetical protein
MFIEGFQPWHRPYSPLLPLNSTVPALMRAMQCSNVHQQGQLHVNLSSAAGDNKDIEQPSSISYLIAPCAAGAATLYTAQHVGLVCEV